MSKPTPALEVDPKARELLIAGIRHFMLPDVGASLFRIRPEDQRGKPRDPAAKEARKA